MLYTIYFRSKPHNFMALSLVGLVIRETATSTKMSSNFLLVFHVDVLMQNGCIIDAAFSNEIISLLYIFREQDVSATGQVVLLHIIVLASSSSIVSSML